RASAGSRFARPVRLRRARLRPIRVPWRARRRKGKRESGRGGPWCDPVRFVRSTLPDDWPKHKSQDGQSEETRNSEPGTRNEEKSIVRMFSIPHFAIHFIRARAEVHLRAA